MTANIQSSTFVNSVFGSVQTANDSEILAARFLRPDDRAIVLDRARRAILVIWGGLEGIKVDEPAKGGDSFSVVRGSVICSELECYSVGVLKDENGQGSDVVCIKGKNDECWSVFDENTPDIMDGTYYQAAEKEAKMRSHVFFANWKIGDFILATNEGSKEDFMGYLDTFAWSLEGNSFNTPALCRIDAIKEMTDEELTSFDYFNAVPVEGFEGGSFSEDVPEDFDYMQWQSLTDAQRHSFIQSVCLVRTPTRWIAVDPQGYDYSRYLHFPIDWRDMFAPEVQEVKRRRDEQLKALQQQAAEEKEARRQDYLAKAKKWENLMVDVRPLEKAERKAWEAYSAAGWKKNSPEDKAQKAASRKLMNARKANILAMCQTAFPGVKFSITVRKSWGADWDLTWFDGPTVDEFNEATDLDLFCSSYDTFDGMTDCAGRESMEFADFSALTMGSNSGSIEIHREWSEDKKQELCQKVNEIAPASRNSHGYIERQNFTQEQAEKIAEAFGMSVRDLFRGYCGGIELNDQHQESIARCAFSETSYFVSPATPEPTATKVDEVQENEGQEAPAEGLQLVEIPGGVAVVGDSRTTYKNRKAIKAHGATWNRDAQQWQGITAEAVAALKLWFKLTA